MLEAQIIDEQTLGRQLRGLTEKIVGTEGVYSTPNLQVAQDGEVTDISRIEQQDLHPHQEWFDFWDYYSVKVDGKDKVETSNNYLGEEFRQVGRADIRLVDSQTRRQFQPISSGDWNPSRIPKTLSLLQQKFLQDLIDQEQLDPSDSRLRGVNLRIWSFMKACRLFPLEMNQAELYLGLTKQNIQAMLSGIPTFSDFITLTRLPSWLAERFIPDLNRKSVALGEDFSLVQRDRDFAVGEERFAMIEGLMGVLEEGKSSFPARQEFRLAFKVS